MPHNNYEGFFLLYSFGVETKSHTSQTLVEKVYLRHLIKLFISRLTLKQQFWILVRSANTKQQSENNVIFKTSVALTGHVKDDECK